MADEKAEEKKPANKKIADVEHPNTSSPSTTSKPVLVTNRPIMQDPMMKEAADEDTGTPIKVTTGSTKIKLQPLTAPVVKNIKSPAEDTPEKPVEAATEKAPAASPEQTEATENPAPETAPGMEPEPAQPKKDDSPPAPEEAEESSPESSDETTSEGDGQPAEVANQEAAQQAEEAKHDEGVQKLIDGKQYFLPINAVEKRRTKRVILLGILLVVVLAVAWVDIALDAGLVEIGNVKPMTHFFSN
jgi:hypothetical protein